MAIDRQWQRAHAAFSDPKPPSQGDGAEGDRVGVDFLSDADWDETFASFDDMHYEQTAGYMTAQWGQKRSSHLVLREGGEIVAGARVILMTIPSTARGIAWVRFGPIWRLHGRAPDPSRYAAIVQALADEYCTRRGLLLAILPRPDPEFGAVGQQMLTELGFVDRQRYGDWDHYFVNLTLDQEAQLASVSRHWRRSLKKAEAANLDIRFRTDEEGYRQFEALYERMVARKHAERAGPIHLLYRLKAALPESVLRLVLVSHQGSPVAGAVLALLGDTAYYILGATSDEALPLSAGIALQWWIVRSLSGEGLRWYDIGGTAGNKGLEVFKSGLSGRQGRVVGARGEYEAWSRASDRIIGGAMFALRPLYRKMSRIGLLSGQR